MALRPAVFDRHIPSVDVSGFAQSLAERAHKWFRRRAGRPGAEDADHWHRLLLRAHRERPCRHRAGENNYEIASPHARPLALTASRDYGSRGPPRIGCAKGSFPPCAHLAVTGVEGRLWGHHQSFSSIATNFRNGSTPAVQSWLREGPE